ncbi:chromatin assembly factor 1 subunit FSM-like [Colossoma macropomum]|uniref:chromatin assembly factor 1 subunit FSM-like n=1 Tax=Colossoma macropomum TaxID=42526 RepID=UPI001864B21A|nr:chromatin assembly factor 1 subunit FSM-like [Colossoma macropomum]
MTLAKYEQAKRKRLRKKEERRQALEDRWREWEEKRAEKKARKEEEKQALEAKRREEEKKEDEKKAEKKAKEEEKKKNEKKASSAPHGTIMSNMASLYMPRGCFVLNFNTERCTTQTGRLDDRKKLKNCGRTEAAQTGPRLGDLWLPL